MFQAILLFCTMGIFLQPIGIGMDLFKCLFWKVSFNQNPSYWLILVSFMFKGPSIENILILVCYLPGGLIIKQIWLEQ